MIIYRITNSEKNSRTSFISQFKVCCIFRSEAYSTRARCGQVRPGLGGTLDRLRYERQDVGMAGCQDSSQLRVTYITNDCGLTEREKGGPGAEWRRETRASADAPRSVGGPMLRASHRLSSRRYADPAARLPYFNASVIGSPPATGILKGAAVHEARDLFSARGSRFE